MFDIPKKEHYQDHPTKRISLYLMMQVVLMKICTAGMGFTYEFCTTLGSIDTSFGVLYLCHIRVKHLTRLGHSAFMSSFFFFKCRTWRGHENKSHRIPLHKTKGAFMLRIVILHLKSNKYLYSWFVF